MTLTDEPTAAAQLMNSVAESRAFAGKYINSNARLIQEGEDADELLRLLNLDPDLYRTECGFINLPKVKAALKHPDDYPLLKPAAPISPTPSADTWSGIMEVCRVRGTHGRSDYITTGNRMDNRCNLRVTFDGSELIKAEVARPPNTPDGMRMFAVIDMSAPIPPRIKDFSELRDELDAAPIPPTHTPSQQEALDAINQLGGQDPMKAVQTLRDFILARPDAPIPPDNHDWKAEYLRQVDLHNQTLDELREAEMQLRNPAPTPPTPSQQKVLSAVDTLLATFDSGYHPELNLIRDFMLARPDAPIPTTGETK